MRTAESPRTFRHRLSWNGTTTTCGRSVDAAQSAITTSAASCGCASADRIRLSRGGRFLARTVTGCACSTWPTTADTMCLAHAAYGVSGVGAGASGFASARNARRGRDPKHGPVMMSSRQAQPRKMMMMSSRHWCLLLSLMLCGLLIMLQNRGMIWLRLSCHRLSRLSQLNRLSRTRLGRIGCMSPWPWLMPSGIHGWIILNIMAGRRLDMRRLRIRRASVSAEHIDWLSCPRRGHHRRRLSPRHHWPSRRRCRLSPWHHRLSHRIAEAQGPQAQGCRCHHRR